MTKRKKIRCPACDKITEINYRKRKIILDKTGGYNSTEYFGRCEHCKKHFLISFFDKEFDI